MPVRITGLSELKQALKELDKNAPKELGKANKQVAQIVVREAERRTPSGPHQGGGSITPIARSIRASQSQLKVSVMAGGSKTPHAGATEFGGFIPRRGNAGANRNRKKYLRSIGGRGLTHVKKQAYLLPAVQAKLADVLIAYDRAIKSVVDKFHVNG